MRNKEVINLYVNGSIILLFIALQECFESEMKEAATVYLKMQTLPVTLKI